MHHATVKVKKNLTITKAGKLPAILIIKQTIVTQLCKICTNETMKQYLRFVSTKLELGSYFDEAGISRYAL